MMYQVDFLPWQKKRLKQRYYGWLSLFFIQISSLILIFFIFDRHKQQYLHQQYLLDNEKIEIAAIEQQLANIEQQRQQLKQLTQQLNTLIQTANHNKRQLYLLQQIPHMLPTGSWLEALSSQIDNLVIKANSHDYHKILQFMRRLTEQKIVTQIQLQTIQLTSQNIQKNHIKCKVAIFGGTI
uniref:Fimbrial assembly protein (PilN) n=1 Tax=Arsenophonus endosymbiont of Trialeurodes vaporariorum TaxID=235567 RepID=A0A3B0M2U4_9GAMM